MSADLTQLQHVWTPLEIGPTKVKHRIMMTAQTILYGEDHILSDRHIAYYRERAKGGVALLLTEQQAGHRLSKGSFHRGCTAWEKRAIPQYAKLADAVHEFGCKQFVQLFACGVHDKGTMIMDEWHPLWAASRVPSIVHREIPMEMEKEHIADIVKGHGESAHNVMTAGLDGVEIHGAHGYLVGQFLSGVYNKRSDEYGGSVANSCRLALEIGESMRDQVGDAITLGLRLSLDEFVGEGGITQDVGEEQLDTIAASGLYDYFSISGGGYHSMHNAVAPMHGRDGFMIPFGERAKEIVGHRAKIFIVGRILEVEMADQIVADGNADMVAMTRAQMAEPFLVTKALEGRQDEIVRCVGANVCLFRAFDQREVTCVMNPTVGREQYWGDGSLVPTNGDAKTIAVVGGGPAGMKAAGILAQRGHSVVLYEGETELGGHLNLQKQLPTRENWQMAIDNFAVPLEKHGVDVRLGVEATASTLLADSPDAVVCATGASYDRTGLSPYRPTRESIPGVEADTVLDVASATQMALDRPDSLGSRVLILDESAEYLALGLAEILADAGTQVEVVTPHMFVGEDLVGTLDLVHVVPRLIEKGVTLTAQQMVERIDGKRVELVSVWSAAQGRELDVDTVVLSMTRSPNEGLYRELRSELDEVHRVGDAVAPRKLVAVVYEAEKLGREL